MHNLKYDLFSSEAGTFLDASVEGFIFLDIDQVIYDTPKTNLIDAYQPAPPPDASKHLLDTYLRELDGGMYCPTMSLMDADGCKLVSIIANSLNLGIVLVSSWIRGAFTFIDFGEMFKEFTPLDCKFVGSIRYGGGGKGRETEVIKWVKEYAKPNQKFLIIDDSGANHFPKLIDWCVEPSTNGFDMECFALSCGILESVNTLDRSYVSIPSILKSLKFKAPGQNIIKRIHDDDFSL